MFGFTLIARQRDALALAADTESSTSQEMERCKVTAKNVFRRLTQLGGAASPYLTVECTGYCFHILTQKGVMHLTMCEGGPTSTSAASFSFLEDVAREFYNQYGELIDATTKAYSFIKFDAYLQKTKKLFSGATARPPPGASSSSAPRPPIVKQRFNELMGYVDSPAGGAGAASRKSGGGTTGLTDVQIVLIAVGAAVLLLFGAVAFIYWY